MAYLTGSRSTFPTAIDQITEVYDLTPSLAVQAARWQVLKLKANKTSEEIDEFNNLTIQLENYILSAEKFNKAFDMVIATQTHYRDNVVGYVELKQLEMQAELDKFTYLGIYNNSTTYNKWNVVTYSGETYLSLVNTNLNHTPNTSPAYWSKIAAQGEQGIPGIGLSFVGNYNSATTYNLQDAVNFNNAIYYCIQSGTDKTPSSNPTYWQLFMESPNISVGVVAPITPNVNQIWIDTN